MPDYPSDYYSPNDPCMPPPVDPCPDGTCCLPPIGPGRGGNGGPSGCGPGKCFAPSSPNPIRYATGALELAANDLSSPGFGQSWGHTRTYGQRLFRNGSLESYDGVNGRNWFVSTAPHLVEVASGSAEGTIAVMGNISATLWFDFVGSGASEYVNRFHGLETLEHDATAHVFRLTSPDGSLTEFHDFDQFSAPQGLFKRQISPGGQMTEVVSYSGGEVGEIRRSADLDGTTVWESLTYVHAWFGRISEIILRRKEGSGPWKDLQRVIFTYWSTYPIYWSEPDRGSGGDLRSAETFERSGTVWNHTGTTYYTYYRLAEPHGFVFGLQHVLGPDAVARLVADGQAEFGDFPTAYYGADRDNYVRSTLRVSATADLAAYADNTFEYDSQQRVTRETVQGGTLSYQYAYTNSSHPEAPANWKTKTTETFPDGTQLLTYANSAGQTLLSVHHTAVGDWIEYAAYTAGHRTLKASPSAVVSYDEMQADLGVVLQAHEGLIELFAYSGPTDPIPDQLIAERIQAGSAGTPITLREYEYTSHTAQGATIYPVSKQTVYKNDDETGAIETCYDYLWHPSTNRIQQWTVTLPEIPTDQNGSDTSATRTEQFDLYGNLIWARTERGVIIGQRIDPVLGMVTQRIDDVDTSIETDAPMGWTTVPGFGLNLITDFEYDELGRRTRELGPEHTIDVDGVATVIRRARWVAYLEDARKREVRTGQGYLQLSDSTQTLINPVAIRQQTPQGRLLEEIQALQGWPQGSSGSSSSGIGEEVPVSVPGPVSPNENEFPQESYVGWTTHQYANCCQLISNRRYHTIPASGIGTSSANYDQTSFDHDTMGRSNRTVTPGGTITFTVFDARSQAEEIWIGTNDDGGTEADPSGAGFEPDNNMVLVTAKVYDNGTAGGDGNLTERTLYVNATDMRVTMFTYDFRSRLVTTDGELDYFEKNDYDNLNRKIKVERYDTGAAGPLIARSEALFDDRGRVYRTIRHGVNPSTGVVGQALTSNTWYDAANNTIQSLPEGSKLFTKTIYDGLNRPKTIYSGYTPTGTTNNPSNATDDVILEQSEIAYDEASNNIKSVQRQRYHNAPDTQTGPLKDPSHDPQARVSYSAMWPDSSGRNQAAANYGTNGGTAFSRPSTIPARSDTVLVTATDYDSAGQVLQTTDPSGMVTRLGYDAAGRQTSQITNYQVSPLIVAPDEEDCDPSADTNVTVLTSYNPDGNIETLTAVNAATGNQVTTYAYGTTLEDSEVASSLLKRTEIYPDSVDADDVIRFAYNRQQQVVQITDQGGTVHQFDFDLLGRRTQDRVTTVGTDVDNVILRIETTYEVRGMKEHLTSHDNATVGMGSIVNDCQFAYNDFGQLVTEYQSHNGAVDPDTTPKVQYAYADGSANTIRQEQLIYPNGRELTYDHGVADGIDDASSRVASLIDDDGTTHLVDYSYLGVGTFVVTDYTEPETKYTLIGTAGGDDPETGDIYRGLDQFGRIKDSYWYNYGDSSDTDRIKFGFDPVGNRLWRENVVATAASKAFDELYEHDQTHRLKHINRGTLNGAHTGISTTTFAQCWTLDETGNWRGFREDDNGDGTWDLIQARNANLVNEISDISESVGPAWISPAYSPAGNMTLMPQPANPTASYTSIYDPWNRLVKVVDPASTDTVSEYVYDGAKRQIVQASYDEGVLDETRHFYYTHSGQWQNIEERLGTTPDSASAAQQFVWGLRYVNDCVVRDRDTDNDDEFDERLYALQDANWNVDAVVDIGGAVQERFIYPAYGVPLALSAEWEQQSEVLAWEILYGSYRFELKTGLYHVRRRALNPVIGSWIQRDPLGLAPDINLYRYVNSMPLMTTDPFGEDGGIVSIPVGTVILIGLIILAKGCSPRRGKDGRPYPTPPGTRGGSGPDWAKKPTPCDFQDQNPWAQIVCDGKGGIEKRICESEDPEHQITNGCISGCLGMKEDFAAALVQYYVTDPCKGASQGDSPGKNGNCSQSIDCASYGWLTPCLDNCIAGNPTISEADKRQIAKLKQLEKTSLNRCKKVDSPDIACKGL